MQKHAEKSKDSNRTRHYDATKPSRQRHGLESRNTHMNKTADTDHSRMNKPVTGELSSVYMQNRNFEKNNIVAYEPSRRRNLKLYDHREI
mmetsp:Transcript_16553/g.19150  ORF Transcript_16553/g.19150 Transcript_16553/m.19150 type:complete len:90 (+) Transcript_16553:345-614(+)